MKYLKISYGRMLVYLTSFTDCSGDFKKNSENDKLTGHFQSFFFRPPTQSLKNNSRNSRISTNEKLLALVCLVRERVSNLSNLVMLKLIVKMKHLGV